MLLGWCGAWRAMLVQRGVHLLFTRAKRPGSTWVYDGDALPGEQVLGGREPAPTSNFLVLPMRSSGCASTRRRTIGTVSRKAGPCCCGGRCDGPGGR